MITIAIHRGASQIGGCITEISTAESKIIIDLGSNLPGSPQPDFSESEIRAIINESQAILYTHYHGDHVGFLSAVPEGIPQYIGAGAREVMRCKYRALNKNGSYSRELDAIERMLTYEADSALEFGDLRVTPYYCSHSAFDAYMFKIQWRGKVILHTGDFRKHGYLGSKLIPMLSRYIGSVDVLIIEGTMLSRRTEKVKTEFALQQEVKALLRKHKYVFALSSSTDIDRLASFYAACKATNRYFYVDRYQKSILDVFTKYSTSPLYDFCNPVGCRGILFECWDKRHIRKDSIVRSMKHRGFLTPIRTSGERLVKSLIDIYADEEPILLYSMWDGYWRGTDNQRIAGVEAIRSLFSPQNIIPMHTSGHADTQALAEVCATVRPKLAIIPIHKELNADFGSLPIDERLKSKVVTSDTTIDDISITIR